MASLFDADAFFERCKLAMEMTPVRKACAPEGCGIVARAIWHIGIRGEPTRRRWFWRLLRMAAPRRGARITRAVTYSIIGEHFVRYTTEEVVPRLERRLAEIRAETAVPRERIARRGWVAAAPGVDGPMTDAAYPRWAAGAPRWESPRDRRPKRQFAIRDHLTVPRIATAV